MVNNITVVSKLPELTAGTRHPGLSSSRQRPMSLKTGQRDDLDSKEFCEDEGLPGSHGEGPQAGQS